MVLFFNSITAQNRIANGGFELRENGASSSIPNDVGQANEIEGWQSQIFTRPGNSVTSGLWENDGKKVHSPDWWNTEEGNYWIDGLKFPYRTSGLIDWIVHYPHTGYSFVGMGYGELIQQDLYGGGPFVTGSGQHLTPGNTYYLSFFMQLFPKAQYIPHIQSNYQNAQVKAFIAANRIEYVTNDNSTANFESTAWQEKKDGVFQNIDLIGSKDLSLTEFPFGSWHQVSFEFVAPNDYIGNDMDWIAIELGFGGGIGTYIGIDDVTLMECPPTESCSPTYGQIWPAFGGSHYSDAPWRITGITNAERLDLEIYPALGGDIAELSISCSAGFPDGWEWNGKSNAQAEFGAGLYVYKLTAVNQCGTSRHTGFFSKVNASNNPTDVTDLFYGCDGTTYVPLKQCCEYEPIMYVDDHYWVDQEFTIHASSELIVASNAPVTVGSGSSVIMRAGERIELNPGFSSDNAEFFLAEIVPCGSNSNPAQRLANPEEEENIESRPEPTASNFNIYPNPNSGTFTISGTDMQQITIMDATGKLVRQMAGPFGTAVEVSSLGAGLYVVRVQMEV